MLVSITSLEAQKTAVGQRPTCEIVTDKPLTDGEDLEDKHGSKTRDLLNTMTAAFVLFYFILTALFRVSIVAH